MIGHAWNSALTTAPIGQYNTRREFFVEFAEDAALTAEHSHLQEHLKEQINNKV